MPEDQSPFRTRLRWRPRRGAPHRAPDPLAAGSSKPVEGRGGSRAWWYVLSGLAVVLAGVAIAVVATRARRAPTSPRRPPPPPPSHRSRPTLPADRRPGPGAHGPGPSGPRDQDRELPRATGPRPASTRPTSSSRSRWRGPSPAWWPCSSARARPWSATSARPASPTPASSPSSSNPLFVHAGGINPVIALMQSSPLIDKNLYSGGNGSAIIQQPGRVAPYSTFVNTATLWALDPSDTSPPAPVFQLLDRPCPRARWPARGPASTSPSRPPPTSPGSGARAPARTSASTPASPTSSSTGPRPPPADVVIMTVPDRHRLVGGEQRGRPRGRRHRHRIRTRGGPAQRRGHHRHLDPSHPDRAGHADTAAGVTDHPPAREQLGGAGPVGIPVTPAAAPPARPPPPPPRPTERSSAPGRGPGAD